MLRTDLVQLREQVVLRLEVLEYRFDDDVALREILHIRRGGKVWINIYPDRPLTKKPAETRMGSGKGSPEWWVTNVKPGRVMFELSFPDEKVAHDALTRAMHKLPMKCRIVRRDEAGEN